MEKRGIRVQSNSVKLATPLNVDVLRGEQKIEIVVNFQGSPEERDLR